MQCPLGDFTGIYRVSARRHQVLGTRLGRCPGALCKTWWHLVAPGGNQVNPPTSMVRGHIRVPPPYSGEIEIWADRGALGMPLWRGKEVTLFVSDCLPMLHAVAKEPLGGAVTVL